MWWFTEDDGVLCLGTEPSTLAGLVISTDIIVDPPIKRKLTESELKVLGDPLNASAEDVQNLAKKIFAED